MDALAVLVRYRVAAGPARTLSSDADSRALESPRHQVMAASDYDSDSDAFESTARLSGLSCLGPGSK